MPDMPGIIRSVSSTETASRRMMSSASPPEPAVSTRSHSRSRIFCSESTIAGSSSTTRTVGAPCGAGIRSMPSWTSTAVPCLRGIAQVIEFTWHRYYDRMATERHSAARVTARRPGWQPTRARLSGGRRRARGRRSRRDREARSGTSSPPRRWLSTLMRPPWRSTMPCTIDSPRPEPSPTSLVVKNGSKMLGITSAGMPGPSSATVISTSSACSCAPRSGSCRRRRARRSPARRW